MTDHLDNDKEELRQSILVEFRQVHKLAPADYTRNCTNVVMSLIDQYTQSKLKAFAEEVEEAVGERKKFNFWNKTSIGMMCEEAYVNGQNNIIDSVSKALKAIKGKAGIE